MSLPEKIHDYKPAELVEGEYRWYIKYYQMDPASGKLKRFRETYNLNRIKSIRERRKKAKHIIIQINANLPKGWPYGAGELYAPSIVDAIEVAKGIKCNTDRQRTIDTVVSTCNVFVEFLGKKHWLEMKAKDFGPKQAVAFLDYLVLGRKVGTNTYNNYISKMRWLFNELVQREYMPDNPFADIRKKKTTGKTRRAFSDQEKEAVIKKVAKEDKWLLLGILLQYHCFIRPIELRRLRFHMIDLASGLIRLSAAETKNRQSDQVTIPDVLLPVLRAFKLDQWNKRWLVFGKQLQPHATKSCGRNSMNRRHRLVLEKLQEKGDLVDIKGLSFYSWKDTGAMDLFRKKVNPLEIMRQLRHKDLATTQLYCQSLYMINEEIKALDNTLLEVVPVGLLS